MFHRLALVATIALSAPVAVAQVAAPKTTASMRFETDLLPLLSAKCGSCHGADKQESNLDLRTRASVLKGGDSGPVVVPGSAAQSLLFEMVSQRKMPPKKGQHLADEQIALIKTWIDQGAKGDGAAADEPAKLSDWWAFRKPVRPAVPDAKSTVNGSPLPPESAARIRNPIDAFIFSKLAEKKLSPASHADRRTLIRRAYFDLVGLPPAPEQVSKFVADPDPNAFDRVVNQLLDSPHYGERWGRHWLDVARYADTGGYETDIYFKNAWRYRDYVVKSFNDDKRYDRFVQEQIAADEIWPDNLDMDGSYVMPAEKVRHLEARIGTGLFALGPQVHESNMDARKANYERLTDWVDTVGSAFMAVTLACARCHDHKFDPLTQRDYYALQAVFAATKEMEIPLVNAMEIADYKQHYPRLLAVDEARKAVRLFDQAASGRSLTPPEQQTRRQLLEGLANAVLAVPETAGSAPNSPFIGLMEVPVATVLGHERPELVPPVKLLSRGDLGRPKQPAKPALPAVLATQTDRPAALGSPFGSRKQLALWLTRADHPLTARVMVNRLWHWHFGRGLVATPNDFGRMGQLPTHPELLDWLATEFVARGWSIKAMHRLMMGSSAYQMASNFAPEANQKNDPENRFYWRANRRRLEAETLWDAVHSVAGTINLKLGGRPVMPPLAGDELTDKAHWVPNADPKEHTRRGLYIVVRRNFRFPMFEVFDAPINAASCAARESTTVAPQALWFMNNHTAFGQSQRFAARLVRETGERPPAWIERAWQLATGRPPSSDEVRESLALVEALAQEEKQAASLENLPAELARLPAAQAAALTKFCLTLLNLNEFVYVD